ncbi:unnamed protein product [Aureobasidium mustum]|uniref:Uncharacterized protein n=1 Tax=Aureobasidium mustum TaxID=2773714 RepID=A0A9N8PK00_9PEZI|nr:unnamed protein product [Aureobasidium mustum]
MPSSNILNIFSNDTRATEFRRAVRSQVARRQEYAVPGSGASAQEVQRAYLRYCREQQRPGQGGGAQQVPPPSYTATANNSPYTSTDNEAPPPYTSAITPTAQLDMLLYSNASTAPSPPGYTEAIATPPPPCYADTVSARSIPNAINQTLSHSAMQNLFSNCTTRTPRKQLHKTAIQALNLVVVSETQGSQEEVAFIRPNKRRGVLRRIKDRM